MHTLAPHLKANSQPKDDGLWLMDIQTKQAKLLVSLHELSRRLNTPPFCNARDLATGLPYNFTTGSIHRRFQTQLHSTVHLQVSSSNTLLSTCNTQQASKSGACCIRKTCGSRSSFDQFMQLSSCDPIRAVPSWTSDAEHEQLEMSMLNVPN